LGAEVVFGAAEEEDVAGAFGVEVVAAGLFGVEEDVVEEVFGVDDEELVVWELDDEGAL